MWLWHLFNTIKNIYRIRDYILRIYIVYILYFFPITVKRLTKHTIKVRSHNIIPLCNIYTLPYSEDVCGLLFFFLISPHSMTSSTTSFTTLLRHYYDTSSTTNSTDIDSILFIHFRLAFGWVFTISSSLCLCHFKWAVKETCANST